MNNWINIPNVPRDERIGSAFNHLFQVINQTENVQSDDLIWNFGGTTFFHPFFLAPLIIYKQRSEKSIKCQGVPAYIDSYFDLVHFHEPLLIDENMDLENMLSSYVHRSYIPVCRFDLCKSNVDALQTVLQRVIERQCNADSKITTPLSYFLGELICNMNQHSHGKYGYIFSQYLNKRENSIDIILADDGITVYGSYARTGKYLDKIGNNDAEALRLANEGYSTKDLPESENRGFGISTSKNMLVDGLKGSFFMLSGNAFHRYDVGSGSTFISLPSNIYWHGTIILMRIPVNVPTGFNYLKYVVR